MTIRTRPRRSAALFALALAAALAAAAALPPGLAAQTRYPSELHAFRLVPVYRGLRHPWSVEFLGSGEFLVAERGGRLLRIRGSTAAAVAGLPAVHASGQGGLLDLVLDPRFAENRTVYFTYAKAGSGGAGTAVARAVLEGDALRDLRVLWEMERKTGAGVHFGSRIRFLPDGTLVFSTGDRGQGERAQDLSDDAGKIHRINADGSIPRDNPFVGRPGAKPTIYSYGHRNIQGLAVNGADGSLWATEHGPQGGDEVNLILPGRNYGWPVITYGRQYGSGAPIGEGNAKAGMEQPLLQWTPSIAPSGLAFYSSAAFPRWRGSLFSGNLAGQRLVRLSLNGAAVRSQEVLLQGTVGRIREVKEGPDGALYLLTDEANAVLYRLEAAD